MEEERGGGKKERLFRIRNAGRENSYVKWRFCRQESVGNAPAKSAFSIFVPSLDKVGTGNRLQLANVYNRQRVTIERILFFFREKDRGSVVNVYLDL